MRIPVEEIKKLHELLNELEQQHPGMTKGEDGTRVYAVSFGYESTDPFYPVVHLDEQHFVELFDKNQHTAMLSWHVSDTPGCAPALHLNTQVDGVGYTCVIWAWEMLKLFDLIGKSCGYTKDQLKEAGMLDKVFRVYCDYRGWDLD